MAAAATTSDPATECRCWPGLMRAQQAADYLGVSVSMLKLLSDPRDPQLATITLLEIGKGERRWPKVALDAYIARRLRTCPNPGYLLPGELAA